MSSLASLFAISGTSSKISRSNGFPGSDVVDDEDCDEEQGEGRGTRGGELGGGTKYLAFVMFGAPTFVPSKRRRALSKIGGFRFGVESTLGCGSLCLGFS